MIAASRIRRQVLAIALIPALLIALLLMLFYLQNRLTGLEENMLQRIRATANGLASASEFALFSGDVTYLRNLGLEESLRSSGDFEVAMLRDMDGRLLIEWGAPEAWRTQSDGLPAEMGHQLLDSGQRLVFHHPVVASTTVADTPLEIESNGSDRRAKPNVRGWVSMQFSREVLSDQRNAIILNSVTITLGGLLLAGLLAFRMSRRLSSRIHHLADTVHRIGHGDLGSRVEVGSDGDLGMLEQGINHMVTALEQSQQRMQTKVDQATLQLRESLKTLAAQESRYRELVQNANSIVVKIDLEGRITFLNEFGESFFGFTEAEILGQPAVGSLVDRRFAERFAEVLGDPGVAQPGPTRHVTRDGRVVYVNWSVRQLHDSEGNRQGIIGIGNNTTENQRIARALGLLSQAGLRGSGIFSDIAKALQTGLDCSFSAIVLTGDGSTPAQLLALASRDDAPISRGVSSLAETFTQGIRTDVPLAIPRGLTQTHPRFRELPGPPESLYAEPILDRDDAVIGCVFAIYVEAWHPLDAEHNLLRLMARRLALELQRQADEQLLTRTRDQALAATEAKSRFLASVSHEIRTPMNGIIGFSKLLMREDLTPRQHDQVGMIQQSALSLLAIINDILDLSKIEAGKLSVAHTSFDLVDTFEELIAMFAVQAHEKGLELCHQIDGDLPVHVFGDAQRLSQVLTNLLGNAIKFTDRGVVSLHARPIAGDAGMLLRVEVSDTGIGIAEEEVGRLFDAFSQLDATASRHHSGTGLGLAISRHLCELLGGRIGVSSRLGEGSNFWVEVPLEADGEECLSKRAERLLAGRRVVFYDREPCVLAAGRALLRLAGARVEVFDDETRLASALEEEADLVIISQAVAEVPALLCGDRLPRVRALHEGPVLVLTCDSINPVSAESCRGCGEWCKPKPLLLKTLEQGQSRRVAKLGEQGSERGWLHGLRLLVCDDNTVNRALAVALLEQYGADVLEARDGPEAIDLASAGCDLVLLDLQMPGMSGRETAQRIRKLLGSACPPLIALTASAMEGERERSLAAGFDDHLTKPLDEALLMQTLRRWLPRAADPGPPEPGCSRLDESAAGKVHDIEGALTITGGRPDLARKMLHLFLEEVPQHRADLDRGWRNNDPAQLKAALHKLRGSAEYCALRRLARAVEDTEETLEKGEIRQLENLLDGVRVELEQAVAEAQRQVTDQE